MSQKIEIILDKEALIKIIKEELVQDENAQDFTEYEVEFFGNEAAAFNAKVSVEIMVMGQKGKLTENISGRVLQYLLTSKFSGELGSVGYLNPIFEVVDGKKEFKSYNITIDSRAYSKSFLKKPYSQY